MTRKKNFVDYKCCGTKGLFKLLYNTLIQESYKLLLEAIYPFELSIFINPFLEEELKKAFYDSNLQKEQYLPLTISEESATRKHEKLLGDFIEFCIKKGINLEDSFENLIEKNEFRNQLERLYAEGYFLHSGIGGVHFWDLQDEFNELIQKRKSLYSRKVSLAPPTTLSAEQKFWIETSKYFSWQRDKRKKIQQKIYYHQAVCLEEISKIINISRNRLECLKPMQFSNELLLDKNRLELTLLQQEQGHLFISVPGEGYYLEYGKETSLIFNNLRQEISSPKEFKGEIACQGLIRGKVKIIINPHENNIFPEGSILVTGMTSPDFVPFMRKASAIITNDGGITCHAAIIAREFNKPCIIGTKIATSVLQDGDLVEVDANVGIVKILKE